MPTLSGLIKDPSAGGPTTDGTTIFTDQWNKIVDIVSGDDVSKLPYGALDLSNSIVVGDIVNSTITYAKIQNVSATNRILGRDSAGAGVIEEITPAALRTMINVEDGANAYVHPNHSGDVTSTGDGATAIAAGVIIDADINGSAAIAATKIHDGSVSNTEFGYLNGVTSAIQTQIDGKADSSHTHPHTEITDFDAGVQTNRLDQMAVPTGSVSMNSQLITSLLDPVSAQDAATKAYVDALKQGLDVKDSVRVASTANLTLSGEQTIDGVLTSTDRILVKDQSDGSENGIYVTAAGAWSRSTDADTSAKVTSGLYCFVEEGTAHADAGFILTTNDPIVLDTTSLTFTQFSGAGQITAGSGLTKSANTINAIGTANRILVNADNIDIHGSYVGQTSITTLGTIGTGVWEGTVIASAFLDADTAHLSGTQTFTGSKTINSLTLGGTLDAAGNSIDNLGGTTAGTAGAILLVNGSDGAITWRDSENTFDHKLYLDASEQFRFTHDDGNNTRTDVCIYRDKATLLDGDEIGGYLAKGESQGVGSTTRSFGEFVVVADTVDDATRDGTFLLSVPSGGSFINGAFSVEGDNQRINTVWNFTESGIPISPIGTHQYGVAASAFYVGTTTPAQSPTVREIGANNEPIQYVEFLDGVDSIAYFDWFPPEAWDAGTVNVKLVWTTEEGSASDTIEIEVSAVIRSNDDAIGSTAYGTAVAITDTWIANDDIHTTAQSGDITIGNSPVAGDAGNSRVSFKLLRDVSAETGSLGGLELIGAVVEYTIDESTSSG